jgi:predicted RNase H-like HicB family nuclease
MEEKNIMSEKPLFVRAEWDDEARVWVATSDDVPGLATEGVTVEGLIQKLRVMIPELLEANGNPPEHQMPFEILTRRFEFSQHEDM